MALDMLTIPAMSTAPERLFSSANIQLPTNPAQVYSKITGTAHTHLLITGAVHLQLEILIT